MGESSNAVGGWYKKNLFGEYKYLKLDEKGNKIYKKTDAEYFLYKAKVGDWLDDWLVSSEI